MRERHPRTVDDGAFVSCAGRSITAGENERAVGTADRLPPSITTKTPQLPSRTCGLQLPVGQPWPAGRRRRLRARQRRRPARIPAQLVAHPPHRPAPALHRLRLSQSLNSCPSPRIISLLSISIRPLLAFSFCPQRHVWHLRAHRQRCTGRKVRVLVELQVRLQPVA